MRILLVADVHIRPFAKEKAANATLHGLKKAIQTANADLIVFLGDTVHGPDFQKSTEPYEKYLRRVLDLTGNTPFATVFGNHDDECDVTKDEILDIISTYPNSLTNGRNYTVDMMGEKLLFIDSGSYYDGEESYYDIVDDATVAWAKSEIMGQKAILFQHIIVPDIMTLCDEKPYYVPFWAYGDKRSVRLKKDVEHIGKMRERPCPPSIPTSELTELSPYLKGACFGHDHLNDFELEHMGVKIIQCRGAGYCCYDNHFRSGVKILDTKSMTTESIFY